MWHTYHVPSTLAEALALRSQYRGAGRIIAGGTDLILEMERGVRQPEALIDISRISGLDCIVAEEGELRLGPLVTHNQVAGTPEAVAGAFPVARACWHVGAPQIRNRRNGGRQFDHGQPGQRYDHTVVGYGCYRHACQRNTRSAHAAI